VCVNHSQNLLPNGLILGLSCLWPFKARRGWRSNSATTTSVKPESETVKGKPQATSFCGLSLLSYTSNSIITVFKEITYSSFIAGLRRADNSLIAPQRPEKIADEATTDVWLLAGSPFVNTCGEGHREGKLRKVSEKPSSGCHPRNGWKNLVIRHCLYIYLNVFRKTIPFYQKFIY
jgi:hypothetical protein